MAWSCRAAWFAHKGAVHRLLADGPTGVMVDQHCVPEEIYHCYWR